MKAQLFLLAGRLCLAQTNAPADDWKPASSNQPGKDYPKVNSEGRVKFRIVAPEGKHRVMSNGRVRLTIPRHNSINPFSMAAIAKGAGLTPEQFQELM